LGTRGASRIAKPVLEKCGVFKKIHEAPHNIVRDYANGRNETEIEINPCLIPQLGISRLRTWPEDEEALSD